MTKVTGGREAQWPVGGYHSRAKGERLESDGGLKTVREDLSRQNIESSSEKIKKRKKQKCKSGRGLAKKFQFHFIPPQARRLESAVPERVRLPPCQSFRKA